MANIRAGRIAAAGEANKRPPNSWSLERGRPLPGRVIDFDSEVLGGTPQAMVPGVDNNESNAEDFVNPLQGITAEGLASH